MPPPTSAFGVIEVFGGLTLAMATLDAMEKAATIAVHQLELNDYYGLVVKITGSVSDVDSAISAGQSMAERLGAKAVGAVIAQVDRKAWPAIHSPREFNPLIQQDVVFFPVAAQPHDQERTMSADQATNNNHLAIGFIETQGFTAVIEAIDSACKAANVEVVGKEKLGGGYVTIVIRGDVAAVKAAIESGKAKVDGLGKLIAAHVIARPSDAVLSLLPKV